MVCVLAPSHFSNTNTQSFNLSTICDQLNNMWFILKYCKHANCWVCAPARVCTSNHLHCQVKSISMDHRFFSSDTSFLYSVVTRAIKPLKQQSEVAPSACTIFPLHFRKCQKVSKQMEHNWLLAVVWYEIFTVSQDAKIIWLTLKTRYWEKICPKQHNECWSKYLIQCLFC